MTHQAPALILPQATPTQQLQYLAAMGITAWTARYRVPYAAETVVCDWPESVPEPTAAQPPVQRLQSLIDDASLPPSEVTAPVVSLSPSHRQDGLEDGRFKALLARQKDGLVHTPALSTSGVSAPPVLRALADNAAEPMAEGHAQAVPVGQETAALRFRLQVASLNNRWLVVLVQPNAPDALEQRLLASMLAAVGVTSHVRATFIDFQWPMMEGLPVESPVIEAQQGIKAFLDGRAREGLSPERLLLFGENDGPAMATLKQVLVLENEKSSLLSLPVWRAPSLSTLLNSVAAKTALWPALHALGQCWDTPGRADRDQVVDL